MSNRDKAMQELLEREASPAIEAWIDAPEEEATNVTVDLEGGAAQFAQALLESNEAMLPTLRRAKIIVG